MSKQPFMPLFLGDLLAATATWKGEARALYVMLLAYQWSAGPLPADPGDIAVMCQYEPENFSRLWRTVGPKFVRHGDGLINLRLEEHRRKAKDVAKKRAKAGAKGRANRDAKPHAKADANDGQFAGSFADPFVPPSNPIQSYPELRGLPGGRG